MWYGSEKQTKEALWEYDKIIRSNCLLRYIDNKSLRLSVRTAQNRIETFHQLKGTIATINAEGLIGIVDDEIILNDQCTRLLSGLGLSAPHLFNQSY